MCVDISGLRLGIDKRTCATVVGYHGEARRVVSTKFRRAIVEICRDFVANEILILKRVLYPIEG